MYDEYRTVPSDQAAVTPRQQQKQEQLLRALVRSPRSDQGSTDVTSTTPGLRDLLNRSAEWQAKRQANLQRARDARRGAEAAKDDGSVYEFQPRLCHPASPHRRSADAYYTAQCEWQQKVSEKREMQRRQAEKEAADALTQSIAAVRRIREANKARVPLRAYASPSDPRPRREAPKPSPRSAPEPGRHRGEAHDELGVKAATGSPTRTASGVLVLATETRRSVTRSAKPAETPHRPQPHPAAALVARSASACRACAPRQEREEAKLSAARHLSRAEEVQLVARLVAPTACAHASHGHATADKSVETRVGKDEIVPPSANAARAFLARQALWARKAQLHRQEAKERVDARRTEAWERECTFAPQISPRSRALASHYADHLAAFLCGDDSRSSPVQPEGTALERLALVSGNGDDEGDETSGPRTGSWTRAEAAAVAAQLEFCEPRINRPRQPRSPDPVRRLLRYTDKSQLRLVCPAGVAKPQRSRLLPAPRVAAPARASRTSSSSSVTRTDPTESIDVASADNRQERRTYMAAAATAEEQDEDDKDDGASVAHMSAQSWPTPPPTSRRSPLSLARDDDKHADPIENVSITSSRARYQQARAQPSLTVPPALDQESTCWVAEKAGSPRASPRWSASALWSEEAFDRSPSTLHKDVPQAVVRVQPHWMPDSPIKLPSPPESVGSEGTVQSAEDSHVAYAPQDDDRMLSAWWHRLCRAPVSAVAHGMNQHAVSSSSHAPPRSPSVTTVSRLPLESALHAMQALCEMLGTAAPLRPRLGFEPSFSDMPSDADGHTRRFNVYLVLPRLDDSKPFVRTTYHTPLDGTIVYADFVKLYSWLLASGAPAEAWAA